MPPADLVNVRQLYGSSTRPIRQDNPVDGGCGGGGAEPAHGSESGAEDLIVGYAEVAPPAAVAANRSWWDDEADSYQAEHGSFLAGPSGDPADADFVWCPEGLREEAVRLLGPADSLRGRRILEVGCGAAQCARWLVTQGADVIGVDLSAGQLRHAQRAVRQDCGPSPLLVQADASALPLGDASIDLACSAFGAIPFVTDSAAVMAEIARVLRPGGRWVFSTNHPMRWCMPDDPGPAGLVVERSYFDRRPYVEVTPEGRPVYVEAHRTMGDRVRELVASGFRVLDVVEPEWPAGHTRPWGQWSPLRGKLFPGTVIFVSELA
jgi:SAM-dependent methyltransferase